MTKPTERIDWGTVLERASVRKKALYGAKTVAVHRLAKAASERTRIVRHKLDGTRVMYCFYFGEEYSFHQPLDAVADEVLDDVTTDELQTTVIDFEPSAETRTLEQSLQEALRLLASRGLDANDYLDAKTVEDYDWGYERSTTFDCLETTDSNEPVVDDQ
ncbi:hypothetical protein [Natronolimnohabitans innermongolicus]|uniref:Uncharacterized protein n=1 Tax=Natronolimnohabitans innermongolicus JCM 12255 TaxID=1227499 RepID=L9WYM0_9EURY|nr:hypothetical protein [Natronolimnohabitans innermongolicus]ELY54492.1 hypothetical protein C493_12544 [Natronolimnohabitans innermongolicus JCM 12255]